MGKEGDQSAPRLPHPKFLAKNERDLSKFDPVCSNEEEREAINSTDLSACMAIIYLYTCKPNGKKSHLSVGRFGEDELEQKEERLWAVLSLRWPDKSLVLACQYEGQIIQNVID